MLTGTQNFPEKKIPVMWKYMKRRKDSRKYRNIVKVHIMEDFYLYLYIFMYFQFFLKVHFYNNENIFHF